MGAAVIGGVGVGLLDSFDRIESFIQFTDTVYPIPAHVKRYREASVLFDEAYRVLEPLFSKISG